MTDVRLYAVCHRRPARLKEISERFQIPKSYTDYRDLLSDPDVDAVSITTHVDNHRGIAVDALASGKHVFLEKPMAGSIEDCEAIVEAAGRAKGKFMVGHICRFDPRLVLARKAVEEGRIGRILSMYAKRNLPLSISGEVLNKISPLLGDGIHDIDIMLWLHGGEIRNAYAQNIRVRTLKYPDIGWAMFKFDSGTIGVIETAWFLPENTPFTIDARMEIIGTEGVIYIDCANAGLTINDRNGIHKPDTVYWPRVYKQRTGVLRTELSYFVECITKNRKLDVITPEESMACVQAILAAERSAETGAVVVV